MRQTIIVALLTAAVTALITAWGTTLIMASGPKRAAAATSHTIDVMSIMKGATNLPVQAFDAF
jgi:hypothetical protein